VVCCAVLINVQRLVSAKHTVSFAANLMNNDFSQRESKRNLDGDYSLFYQPPSFHCVPMLALRSFTKNGRFYDASNLMRAMAAQEIGGPFRAARSRFDPS
jgi:hypothetical protein